MKRTQIKNLVLSHINRAIALVATSGLMTLVACSSSSKPVTAAQAQPPQTQAASPPSQSASASETRLLKPVSAVAHPVVHRNPAATRDAMTTFRDSDFGISLQYPWQYGFKGGHKLRVKGEQVENSFVAPGGINLATIDVPAGYYDKTDFERAFLNVNVNRKLTADQCSQFTGSDNASDKLVPAKAKIGDQEYVMIQQKSDDSILRTYHAYEGGACYEFVLGLNTNDTDGGHDASEDKAQQIKPVSQKQVFSRLEKIMETVTFESDQDGSAVASAPASADLPQKP